MVIFNFLRWQNGTPLFFLRMTTKDVRWITKMVYVTLFLVFQEFIRYGEVVLIGKTWVIAKNVGLLNERRIVYRYWKIW